MNTRPRTALILGGGGPLGIAWEAGLLLGLRDRGVNLACADRIVGTSAGAIVGAHLAVLGSVDSLYESQSVPLEESGDPPPKFGRLLAAFVRARLLHRSVEGQRRSIAKAALKLNLPGEARWCEVIAANMPRQSRWPARALLITAVDCLSGELKLFDAASDVPLALAAAASCAVPCVFPLVHVQGRLHMDGGIGSPNNALLGLGHERVIVMAPTERLFGRHSPLGGEVRTLQAKGSKVVIFAFDAEAHRVSGNLADVSKRGEMAELGRQRGREAAAGEPLLAELRTT